MKISPVDFRRHLHRNPELSYEEHKTAQFICDLLDAEKIPYRKIAGTGVLAKLEGRGDLKKAIVLRADIDALPVTEATDFDFASQNEGVMHACGHDIHAAVLYGVLCALKESGDFDGTIFGVFQPGEELNPGGASLVLKEEPFEGYEVQAVIGEHVEGTFEVGRLGFREGKYMASSDEIRFYVRGVGGHGAMREKVKDPLEAAAALLLELLKFNREFLVLSIGKFVADGATNVIPQSVYLEGTMRTFDEGERAEAKTEIEKVARKIETLYEGRTVEVNISHGYPCVVNDASLTKSAIALAEEMGFNVESLALRTTSEDFGFYTTRYPSLFYRLGAGPDVGAPHTSTFCPKDDAIEVGVQFMLNLAKKTAQQ